jgi:hypothetical protein
VQLYGENEFQTNRNSSAKNVCELSEKVLPFTLENATGCHTPRYQKYIKM